MTSNPRKSSSSSYGKATLGSLLRHFVDQHLTVELKNGRQYRGILSSAEDSMSLQLVEAVQLAPRGSTSKNDHNNQREDEPKNSSLSYLPTLFVRGSTIRYIHFPNHCNLAGTIKAGREREKSAAHRYQRGIRKQPTNKP